jgi:hypothetical protein
MTQPTQRKRPWPTWAMTLAFFVGSIIVTAIAVAIIFPGRGNRERRNDLGHAAGGVLFFATIAVAFGQSYRRRRWERAARAETLGEPVLTSTTGVRIVDDRPQPGRIDLTATRIVFYRASNSDGWWGQLIGVIASGRGHVISLEIPLAAVVSTARTRFRSAGNALDVTMTDGAVHRLALDRFAPFEAQLVPALARVRAAAAAAAPT